MKRGVLSGISLVVGACVLSGCYTFWNGPMIKSGTTVLRGEPIAIRAMSLSQPTHMDPRLRVLFQERRREEVWHSRSYVEMQKTIPAATWFSGLGVLAFSAWTGALVYEMIDDTHLNAADERYRAFGATLTGVAGYFCLRVFLDVLAGDKPSGSIVVEGDVRTEENSWAPLRNSSVIVSSGFGVKEVYTDAKGEGLIDLDKDLNLGALLTPDSVRLNCHYGELQGWNPIVLSPSTWLTPYLYVDHSRGVVRFDSSEHGKVLGHVEIGNRHRLLGRDPEQRKLKIDYSGIEGWVGSDCGTVYWMTRR